MLEAVEGALELVLVSDLAVLSHAVGDGCVAAGLEQERHVFVTAHLLSGVGELLLGRVVDESTTVADCIV